MNGRHTLAGSHIGVGIAASVLPRLWACSGTVDRGHQLPVAQRVSITLRSQRTGADGAGLPHLLHHGPGLRLRAGKPGPHHGARDRVGRILVAAVGSVMAAITILRGQSTVLYTFYPMMQAHPLFYIGATLLVVGSWIWGGVMIASYRSWRREHPGVPVPLSMHGMLATVIIWYLATSGLAIEVVGMLIPWSLGMVDKIDPMLARIYFWWFGHPFVYFLLLPAYVLWYYVLRGSQAGGSSAIRSRAWRSSCSSSSPLPWVPSSVHGPRHQRWVEAGPYRHHVCRRIRVS